MARCQKKDHITQMFHLPACGKNSESQTNRNTIHYRYSFPSFL